MTETRELTASPQPTEPLVSGRMPSMTDEPLSVLTRREPLSVEPGFNAADLRSAMEGRVLATGRLTGTYRRGG